jgi:hypothetical protein
LQPQREDGVGFLDSLDDARLLRNKWIMHEPPPPLMRPVLR